MSNRLYSKNLFVKSGLITGTQWDMIMKFLSNKTDYSDMKSTSWENYYNVSLGGTEKLKKSLYDIAGNLWELTQETSYKVNLNYKKKNNNTYVVRGGSFSDTVNSACYRGYCYAPETFFAYGFRPVLYIK